MHIESNWLKAVLSSAYSSVPKTRRIEEVDLSRAVNRVLAEDIVAVQPVPRIARAATVGCAVSASAFANAAPDRPIEMKSVRRFETAPLTGTQVMTMVAHRAMPEGADTLIPLDLEEVCGGEEANNLVRVDPTTRTRYCISPPVVGTGVTQVGSEVEAGAVLARAGDRLSLAVMAAAALAGVERVKVNCKPSAGIILMPRHSLDPDQDEHDREMVAGFRAIAVGALNTFGVAQPAIFLMDPPVDHDVNDQAARDFIASYDLVLIVGQAHIQETGCHFALNTWIGGAIWAPDSGGQHPRCQVRIMNNDMRGLRAAGRLSDFVDQRRTTNTAVIQLMGSPAAALAMMHLLVKPTLEWFEGFDADLAPASARLIADAPIMPEPWVRLLWGRVSFNADAQLCFSPLRVPNDESLGPVDTNAFAIVLHDDPVIHPGDAIRIVRLA